MRKVLIARRLFLVVALCLAMASTGLAHRSLDEHPDPGAVAFLQSGGSLDDICGGHDGPTDRARTPCEACRLVSAAILPSPLCPRGSAFFARAMPWPAVDVGPANTLPFDPRQPARGPPRR